MVSYETFRHALNTIEGTQWRSFEQLANVFLADEFQSLRPMTTSAGDDGMDAQLFQPTDDEGAVLQFSLRKDWSQKIKETCKRLRSTTPGVSILIYATNQKIGALANGLKKEIRSDYGIYLDVRDQDWFLTARNRTIAIRAEVERFAEPFLVGKRITSESVIERQAQALDDLEAKAAFVYLELQWVDDTRDKGLTRVCFEAIVRSVLRGTTSEHRMTRAAVKEQVAKLLPAQHSDSRDRAVDSALGKLAKVYIRHWQKQDEFCLTWDERQRLDERLTEVESMNSLLNRELESLLKRISEEDGSELNGTQLTLGIARCRSVLERVLLERGAVFAETVVHERGVQPIYFEDIEAVVYNDFAINAQKAGVEPRVVATAINALMINPPEEARAYLRNLADTYTLFAFMRETPDVQSAVVKIFSEGDIWLDSSVVLPLFAEELLDEGSRAHGLMLKATREAGLRLFVTEGVVEELASHINKCRGYYSAASNGEAYGSEPFLLASYKLSGRTSSNFLSWLENFCGRSRPEDDIEMYLNEEFSIEVRSLAEFVDRADGELIAQVGEIWHESRDARDERRGKQGRPPMDAGTRARLVQHDVENYVGVQMRREVRNEKRAAFGYTSWWLTLDGTAFRVARELEKRLGGRPLASPAISPDFMLHYLTVGPVRARLSRRTEDTLPLMLNMSILAAVPSDLLELSDALRKELVDMPPRVVRRKIRDTLDEARLLLGAQAAEGERGLTERVRLRLIEKARIR